MEPRAKTWGHKNGELAAAQINRHSSSTSDMDRIGKAQQKYEFCKGTLFDAARIFAGIGTGKDIFDPENMTGNIPQPVLFENSENLTNSIRNNPTMSIRPSPPSQAPSKVNKKWIQKIIFLYKMKRKKIIENNWKI